MRTSALTTPALAAAAIFVLTALRFCPQRIGDLAGSVDVSWSYIGCRRAARTIRSTVVRSRAARALGARPGAAWWMSAFSCSLLWLYSSGMPSRWPYSWAAMTLSSAV